jgi:hypothetical protein
MLNKIAMITLLAVMIIFGLIITLVLYIIIVGANMDKNPEERKKDDEEQMRYLKEYKNRKNGGK